jgi:hypothetical protein
MERALRERREGADLLDLVPEELDPERLAARGREDVDDAASDCDLTAFLGALDALVPSEREPLGYELDPRFVPDRDAQRLRARVGRRHRLCERDSGGADEPAGGEHLQCSRALADEMRRRLETRPEADAPAREERDPLVAEKPGGSLGRISCIRVLGQEADESSSELVKPGEDERQRGLRDARIGVGQCLHERVEALLLEEPFNEHVEHGTVHDESPETAFRGREW